MTQLAMAEFQAALDCGKQPLYVCYNRPLADHFLEMMPQGGRVPSFDVLCDTFAREHGILPDYSSPSVWADLETHFASAKIPENWRYDVVIVDEGQDFLSGGKTPY